MFWKSCRVSKEDLAVLVESCMLIRWFVIVNSRLRPDYTLDFYSTKVSKLFFTIHNRKKTGKSSCWIVASSFLATCHTFAFRNGDSFFYVEIFLVLFLFNHQSLFFLQRRQIFTTDRLLMDLCCNSKKISFYYLLVLSTKR